MLIFEYGEFYEFDASGEILTVHMITVCLN